MSEGVWAAMKDMAIDRVVSRKQLVDRYGASAYRHIQKSVQDGMVAKHDFRCSSGRIKSCYHLTKMGRAAIASREDIVPSRIPYTVGFKGHILHTLAVGETRYRLSCQGYEIVADYSNSVEKFTNKIFGDQADLYIIKEGKPVVAVEIDRGYRPKEVVTKLSEWRFRDLEVWWFAEGIGRAQKLEKGGFEFDRLYDLDKLGWRYC
ncbi:hypothetical protein [Gloeobacter morelensis]|uniref:hypothetical protein n=1 Tax=Gloeobacter morelensis TaxID=2907343 RepID=UPI001E2AF2E6|nr:hypothetical protein [Gloeobacter morelensis]UFP97225.1 hypothetical protein ISF26_24190 [Gloeobacter morelensis MG652769]